MSREHDIFYGPQRQPDGSIVMDFSVHEIGGQLACVKCDEVWPCRAVLAAELRRRVSPGCEQCACEHKGNTVTEGVMGDPVEDHYCLDCGHRWTERRAGL